MEIGLQPGYVFVYKLWSDFKVYTITIENAVKYKILGKWGGEWIKGIRFYDKKGNVVFSIESRLAVHSIRMIQTTNFIDTDPLPQTLIQKIKTVFRKIIPSKNEKEI